MLTVAAPAAAVEIIGATPPHDGTPTAALPTFPVPDAPGAPYPDRSATPEPATWAMVLLGFGLIGLGLARRARSARRR